MDEISWSNDFYSDMFSLDFETLFSTVDSESFSHFVIDTINSPWANADFGTKSRDKGGLLRIDCTLCGDSKFV